MRLDLSVTESGILPVHSELLKRKGINSGRKSLEIIEAMDTSRLHEAMDGTGHLTTGIGNYNAGTPAYSHHTTTCQPLADGYPVRARPDFASSGRSFHWRLGR